MLEPKRELTCILQSSLPPPNAVSVGDTVDVKISTTLEKYD